MQHFSGKAGLFGCFLECGKSIAVFCAGVNRTIHIQQLGGFIGRLQHRLIHAENFVCELFKGSHADFRDKRGFAVRPAFPEKCKLRFIFKLVGDEQDYFIALFGVGYNLAAKHCGGILNGISENKSCFSHLFLLSVDSFRLPCISILCRTFLYAPQFRLSAAARCADWFRRHVPPCAAPLQ